MLEKFIADYTGKLFLKQKNFMAFTLLSHP